MADGYLGNSNLKRIGEEIEWSPDLLQEYMKCAKVKLTPKLKVSKVSDFLSPSPDY